ncbi:MAG: hypothetical protein AAB303_02690 [Chloroflexota bacterium]
MVESFVLLSALGGECLEDMQHLRDDAVGPKGLEAILGYRMPAPETARPACGGLDKFHDEASMLGRPLQGSFIPVESSALAGLNEVKRRTVSAYVNAIRLGNEVTLDVDAQLIETSKADAKYCYEGYKAYQPIQVSWAETMLVLADEFRDGNVPASKDIRRVSASAAGGWSTRPMICCHLVTGE